MTLTLRIRNVDRLDNGSPTEFVLHRRGAIIGRAATCDWSLPDPRSHISSRHAEVSFRDGFYFFTDISTNGTFLNGNGERMAEPRRVEGGDLFLIGHYEVQAALSGAAVAAVERQEQQIAEQAHQQGGFSWDRGGAAPPPPVPDRGGWGDAPANGGLSSGAGGMAAPMGGGWGAPAAGSGADGWGAAPAPSPAGDWGAVPAAPAGDGWGSAPAPSADSGWGAAPTPGSGGGSDWGAPAPSAQASPGWASAPAPGAGFASAPSDSGDGWAPPTPAAAPEPERAPSAWESAPAPVQQASAWSSAAPDRPRSATPNDIWGSMEQSNVVDWGRAFGDQSGGTKDMLGLGRRPSDALPAALPAAPTPLAPPDDTAGWSSTPAAPPPSPPPLPPAPAAPIQAAPPAAVGLDMAQVAVAFATTAGLKPEQIREPSADTLERAAQVMRRLVSGLVVMVEARARAKSQMGAEQTGLEFDGNNPIKFARTPDQALAQLLNPPERGFMPSEKAIEDAFFDLQSHQMATLKAMQGALRATLDRFSPAAIKKRAESGGFLTRILPGGRDATLWQTYEKEFSGVSQGSDEAFMDVFAKEFRQAYEEANRNRKR